MQRFGKLNEIPILEMLDIFERKLESFFFVLKFPKINIEKEVLKVSGKNYFSSQTAVVELFHFKLCSCHKKLAKMLETLKLLVFLKKLLFLIEVLGFSIVSII